MREEQHWRHECKREQLLTGNEVLHHALIVHSPVGILLEDDSRRILEANARLCEMFGYGARSSDLVGADCAQAAREYAHLFVDPEDFVGRIEEILRQRRAVARERLSLADGRIFERDYVPAFAGERYLGHAWHYHDITERKQAETELQQQHDLLRAIIDSADETVFVKDLEHQFLLSNSRHQEMLGAQSQDELLGKTNADVWSEKRAAPHHADDRWVMDEDEALIGREEKITHASGERRWLSTTKVPLQDSDGRVTGLVAVSRDVTERKQYEEALQESERRLAEAQSLAGVGSWEWDLVTDSISWSAQQYRNFGLDPEEFEPTFKRFLEHVHPEDRDRMERSHRESLAEGGSFEWEYRLVRPTGEVRDMHTRGQTFADERADPVRMAGTDHDITGRKAAEKALRQSEERFRQLFEQSVEALIVHDGEGRIVDVNPETCDSLGYTRQELLQMSIPHLTDDLLTPEERREREQTGGTLWQRIVAGDPTVRNVIHHGNHRRKDGATFPIEVRVGGVDYGGERMVLASVRDVTEHQELEQRLEYQALHDPLTGLANRDLALHCIEQAVARAGRTGGHAAILFMDLDNFKVINDSLGHEAGDRLLTAIAGRLRKCVRQTDTAARIGGDEFLIVLDTVDDESEAAEIARRIHERLNEPYILLREEVFVGLSIGIAVGGAAGEGAGEMLRRADLAMYRAKAERETSYKVFDSGMDREIRDRMAMENDLRRALREDEFELYYQPKVCLKNGSPVAFEALLRWNHPERGLLLPADFLPLAEDLGLTVPLGRWVLEEACSQRKQWQDLYPGGGSVKVCVNVSGKQLEQDGFAEEVFRTLSKHGLQPGELGLELTEGAFIGEDARTADALSKLRQMGVLLLIDDFGVGYSSLSYLKRLAVQFLKIDSSFIEELGKRNEETTMVRAILEISHAYGIQVIAEGVQTEEQLSILRQMGCDLAQGHFFEAALPASGARAWLPSDQA